MRVTAILLILTLLFGLSACQQSSLGFKKQASTAGGPAGMIGGGMKTASTGSSSGCSSGG